MSQRWQVARQQVVEAYAYLKKLYMEHKNMIHAVDNLVALAHNWPGPDAAALAVLQQLLAAGADPNQVDPDIEAGMSALMLAAYWRDVDAVQCLLAAGADPNLTAASHGPWAGYTALMVVCDLARTPIHMGALGSAAPVVHLLLEAGADPEAKVRGRQAGGGMC